MGLPVPFVTNATRTEGSLVMTVTGSRAATLGTAGNPFSVTTARDTITTNGRTATSTFVRASRKEVSTSPGRRTQTMVLDAHERLASLQVELRRPDQLRVQRPRTLRLRNAGIARHDIQLRGGRVVRERRIRSAGRRASPTMPARGSPR